MSHSPDGPQTVNESSLTNAQSLLHDNVAVYTSPEYTDHDAGGIWIAPSIFAIAIYPSPLLGCDSRHFGRGKRSRVKPHVLGFALRARIPVTIGNI